MMDFRFSSKYTTANVYISVFVVLFMLLVVWILARAGEFEMRWNTFLGIIIFLVLVFCLVYQALYICTASVVGDKLILKKMFRKEKVYEFSKIHSISSFRLKRNKYTLFKVKNKDYTDERFLILNTYPIFGTSCKYDAEEVLYNLQKLS